MAEARGPSTRTSLEQFHNVSSRISRTLGAADDATLGVAVMSVLEDLAGWAAADGAFVTLVDEALRVSDEWHWAGPDYTIVPPSIGSPLAETFGSALEFLKVGHTVASADLDALELSPEERKIASANNLRAMVIAPVRVAGVFLGVVGLHVYGRPHAWAATTVDDVELVASVLLQAVVRTRQRGLIEQVNARARRIARFVPSPLVMVDRSRRVTWVSPSYSAFTGRSAGDVLGSVIDTLFVPEDAELLAALQAPGQLTARLRLADGTWRWTELSWQAFDDEDGGGGLGDEAVLELRDVHDRQVQADELRRNADHDPLTGALNRTGLSRRLAELAAEDRTILTAFCDLNGFKGWNDTRGHDAGDVLLRSVATALTAAVRPADLVARVGGDEFVVIVVDPTGRDRRALVDRLEAAVEELTHGAPNPVTVAVGLSEPGPAADAANQRLDADGAMYRRKLWHGNQ